MLHLRVLASNSVRAAARNSSRRTRALVSVRNAQAFEARRYFVSSASLKQQQETSSTTTAERLEFKAETKKLLDIVTNSLYSDREIFLRELVSNASDALEKRRHTTLTESSTSSEKEGDANPLEINIFCDSKNKTLTIADSGIGMTREELIQNLGTIAYSGSKAFLEKLESSGTKDRIIGQFGVGFYSAFMVADKITVYTKKEGSLGYQWESDGSGAYTVSEAPQAEIGTKIVLNLKPEFASDYSDGKKVGDLIKKYSNFVGFPVRVDSRRVNVIEPLWAVSDRSKITDEQYKEFYKFISNSFDDPVYRLHLSTDVPLSIKALLYVPESNMPFAFNRNETGGISLYSRKVLILAKTKDLLPEWARFIRGVVDSEDIPLNLSREILQRGPVMTKLKDYLISRIVRWLEDEKNKDLDKYRKFFDNFGAFLREGVCTDPANKDKLAKLLLFESSADETKGNPISLDKFIENFPENESEKTPIYYLCATNRQSATQSPYLEPLTASNTPCLFVYDPLDEVVFSHLHEFKGRKILSVEQSGSLDKLMEQKKNESDKQNEGVKMEESDRKEFMDFLKDACGQVIGTVKESKRLSQYPALIVDHQPASVRRMLKLVAGGAPGLRDDGIPRDQTLEINLDHPVCTGLNSLRKVDKEKATLFAQQVVDNALLAAGLLDDPRVLVPRLNELIKTLVTK